MTAATAGAAIGIKFNSSVEAAETKMMAFMKDNERVAKTLAWVKDEASATQFAFAEMAEAAANLTPVAKSSGKSLEDLVRQAELLASLNPAEGLTGATFALREALSGDWVSIVERFNLPRLRINELKAQGVPAMEIITKTLNEMGIDMSLVAKQGQTTAARFDQVKDKLTMMAGAATKPIFTRISSELDVIGRYDFAGLGENLAGVVGRSIDAVDEFIPKAVELGRQVGGYLGPKFDDLWRVLEERVFPVTNKLRHEVIEPLIPVLGVSLVGAIGLGVDATRLLVEVLGWLYDELEAGNPWVWTLAGAFGGLAAAMALNATFNAFNAGLAFIRTVTIPQTMVQMAALNTLISTPMVMPAIAIGAALAAIATVWNEYNKMQSAIEGAKAAQKEFNSVSKELDQKYLDIYHNGVSSPKAKELAKRYLHNTGFPGFAMGTNYAPGGSAWVGEHGPELVDLPRGSKVSPAYRSQNNSVTNNSPTVVIQNMNINNGGDAHRMLNDIGFALRQAS
ncbi:hypothetical protein ACWFRF_15440 [Nocardia sp. NPDC055165]